MSWFYNSYSGELTSASGVKALAYEAAIHTGTGWHELPIPASDTEAQAAEYVKANFAGSTAPTTSITGGLGNAVTNNPITNAIGKAFDYVVSVNGFSGTNFVLRAVKIIIGGVLLISGLIHISGVDKSALGIASKAVIPA